MHISQCNWQAVEEFLKKDDRCVVPLGSTEQHAYLSLSTDSILAERVSADAAAPIGIPVFPVMPYGSTPQFMAYPGTITLRLQTLFSVVEDVLDSLVQHGFRRILIVNGHGGNNPVANYVHEWRQRQWQKGNNSVKVKFHSWWNAPKTLAKVQQIDPQASHASWMENFQWTRLERVIQPTEQKLLVDMERLKVSSPEEARSLLGDGNYWGLYCRSDADMQALWDVAVAETRELIEGGWD